jgi:fructose-1,6-bisphosphatase I
VIIKRGGVFTYPALKKAPQGKLRLLFELQPMAFIMEQAGGRATDGKDDILALKVASVNQCSPVYIGSATEVNMAGQFLSQ